MVLDESDNEEKEDFSKSYHDIFGERCPEFKSNDDSNSSKACINSKINNYTNLIDTNELRTKINYKDFIRYVIDIVKKTVKCEDTLIKQIVYAAISSYIQSDPINLAIIAPTSEGK